MKRRNQLAPARESQHQVLFHKTKGDVEIGHHESLVNIDRRSPARCAKMPMLSEVPRIMTNEAILRCNLGAEDHVQFFPCRLPMQPGCDQDRDSFHRDSCLMQASEQRRQGQSIRCGTRDVADGDRGGLLSECNPGKRPASDGMIERRVDGRGWVVERLCAATGYNLAGESVRHGYVDAMFAEGESCLHLLNRPLQH